MGYQKIGFVVKPRSTYLLDIANNFEQLKDWGKNLDKGVTDALKTLGKENIRLSNIMFERLLTISGPGLDGSDDNRRDFILLLSSYLHEIGIVSGSPVIVDYVTDPALALDDVILRMLASRMPKFTLDQIGGQYSTIDSLTYFFSDVIRRYALILKEAPLMVKRFRQWLGNLGYKVITGQQLSQHELTAFVMYGNTERESLGWSKYDPDTSAIPAAEINDLMVNEVAELYKSVTLPGPYWNHQKIISDTLLQRLTAYFGPHTTDLRICTGYLRMYGPFTVFELTPQDSIAWSIDDHLAGITARTSYLMSNIAGGGSYAIRVPNILDNRNDWGTAGLFPDDPSFAITLTDETNIANFEWDYYSQWRGVRVNSKIHSATEQLALADKALEGPSLGACNIEHATLENIGIALFTDRAHKKLSISTDKKIEETYLLPTNSGSKETTVDMTAYYSRLGNVIALPAFSEYLELPQKFFMQPQPRVVEYVASVMALPLDEKIRFTNVIALYHNVERFKRITGKQPPLDRLQLAKAMLNI